MSVPSFPRLFMLAAAVLSALLAVAVVAVVLSTEDRMIALFQPLGGDFINLYAVARMVVGGYLDAIYDPQALMAFQHGIIDADLGLRLWAYPPPMLFFVWPFAFLSFEGALAAWSALGLAALVLAARHYGFSWVESLILAASPASIACLLLGQTGLFVTALVLLAFRPKTARDPLAVAGTAILTVKPQAGFLIPVLWLLRGEWRLILYTCGAILLLVGASVLAFGIESWRAYVLDTVSVIAALERSGSGPFMLMMPSLFMAARLVGIEGGPALILHFVFAVPVALWLIWRLKTSETNARQDALALVGLTLITPYLHLYDLPLLAAAVLIVLNEKERQGAAEPLRKTLLVLAWLLPVLLMPLNAIGLPLAPVLLFALFVLV